MIFLAAAFCAVAAAQEVKTIGALADSATVNTARPEAEIIGGSDAPADMYVYDGYRGEALAPADSLHLPMLNRFGQAYINMYPYSWFGLYDWQLHKGLNVSLGASVFAVFGDSPWKGAGFAQSISAMYAVPITDKLSFAVGGYMNNVYWSHDPYRDAGINAVLGYKFDEHWEGYIFGQNEDGSWNPDDLGIDTEGSIQAYEMINSLIEEKVIPTNMAITLMQTKFRSGKAAILLDGSWDLANFREAGINVGIAPIPEIQISETEKGTPLSFSGGYGLAINSYSLNIEESIDFLKFATRDEYVLAYYQDTGRIPSTTGCAEDPEVLADECLAGFFEQLEYSYPQPAINELNAVWDPLSAAAISIFTNKEDAATVMHKVAEDVKANIDLIS